MQEIFWDYHIDISLEEEEYSMNKNVQRIGVGNRRFPDINESVGITEPGIFTFDNTTLTFDSMVDTFDFDIVPTPPVVKREYSVNNYSESEYK